MSGQETARLDNAGTLQNSVSTSLEIEKVAIVSCPSWRKTKCREERWMKMKVFRYGKTRLAQMFSLDDLPCAWN
jgi:hypothetical protein